MPSDMCVILEDSPGDAQVHTRGAAEDEDTMVSEPIEVFKRHSGGRI